MLLCVTVAGLAAAGYLTNRDGPLSLRAGGPTTRNTRPTSAPPPGQRPPVATPSASPSAARPPKPPAPPAPPKPSPSRTQNPASEARSTTGSNAVALTFDDGPSPEWTPQFLDYLREQGVKATFCVVGTEVRSNPALVARIVREGHTLCNHSWHHDLTLGSKSVEEIRADLLRTNAEILKAVPGARIAYYRQPGGEWTQRVIDVARSLGMTPLGWAVDPKDWEKPPAETIASRVHARTRGGSIVLMHDGGGDRSHTLAALHTILADLKARYRLIALPVRSP